MKDLSANAALLRALALSHDMLDAAEAANVQAVGLLDAERLELLKFFRLKCKQVNASDRALLQQISQLNQRAIGLLEHLRRSKGRELDMAAVGRRAVAAYGGIRPQR
jgi:hypothetical protein